MGWAWNDREAFGKTTTHSQYGPSVRQERAILMGVALRDTDYDAKESLQELAALAGSAGAIVVDQMIQKRDRPSATSTSAGARWKSWPRRASHATRT